MNRNSLLRIFPLALLMLGLTACNIPGCPGELVHLSSAKLTIEKLKLTSDFELGDRNKGRSTPGQQQQRTPTCAEFSAKTTQDDQIFIFVDANATGHDREGRAWETASRSIKAALHTAMSIREEQLNKTGQIDKTISIIVAGGTYSLDHERQVLEKGVGKDDSILNFEGNLVGMYQKISVLGGYKNGDPCIEIDKNIAERPDSKDGRETILDGEGDSNHVINIASDAKDIVVKNFTIKGGNADGNTAQKKYGGAILIHTAARDITLEDLKISGSQAEIKGGCLAIMGSDVPAFGLPADGITRNINLTNLQLADCTAVDGGGGIYIGRKATRITARRISIDRGHATAATSNGGGVLIEGEVATFSCQGLNISNSDAGRGGGGISIREDANNIALTGVEIANNKATQPTSFGGGVSIEGLGVNAVSLTGGKVTGNEADQYGAGIYVSNTPVQVAQLVNTPNPELIFVDLEVDNNHLTGPTAIKKGAGIMVRGPTGDIRIRGGSISRNHGNAEGIGLSVLGRVVHLEVDNVTIAANVPDDGAARNGNGVHLDWENNIVNAPNVVKLTNNRILNHSAGNNGAGLYARRIIALQMDHLTFDTNTSSERGGGAFILDCNTIAHSNITYTNNVAENFFGGGLWVENNRDGNFNPPSEAFPMEDISCTRNSAGTGGGCASISIAPGTVIRRGSYIDNGIIQAARGINEPTWQGGAINYVAYSTGGGSDNAARFEIDEAVFRGNIAKIEGGAVFVKNVFDLIIGRTQFINNEVTGNGVPSGDGGAVFADFSSHNTAINVNHQQGATVTVQNGSAFNRNRAPNGKGGALCLIGGVKSFVDEGRETQPGVLRMDSGAPPLLGHAVTFNQNIAGNGSGGGVFVEIASVANSVMSIGNMSFDNNTASLFGGGLRAVGLPEKLILNSWVDTGSPMIPGGAPAREHWLERASSFSSNIAGTGGGALSLALVAGGVAIKKFTTQDDHFQARHNAAGVVMVDANGNFDFFQVPGNNFLGNKALAGNGGAILLGDSASDDVLIGSTTLGNTSLDTPLRGTFNNNEALIGVGGAVAFMGKVMHDVAAPLVTPGPFNVRAHFTANRATVNPAIHFARIPTPGFEFIGASFANHKRSTNGCGGAIEIDKPIETLTFNGGSSTGNQTTNGSGGVICVDRVLTTLNVNSHSASSNDATAGSGGFLSITKGSPNLNVAIQGSSFSNNHALGGNGGVLDIPEANNVSITTLGQFTNMLHGFSERYSGVIRDDWLTWRESITRSMGNQAAISGGIYFFGEIHGNLTVQQQVWLKNDAKGGSGGSLFIRSLHGNATFTDPLFYGNTARIHGGAVAIINADRNIDVAASLFADGITHPSYIFPPGIPAFVSRGPRDRVLPQDFFGVAAEVLAGDRTPASAINYMGAPDGFFAMIPSVGDTHAFRGQILVDSNTVATGNGGAFYFRGANDVKFTRMSFTRNTATNGSGGTVFLDDLRNQLVLDQTMVLNGTARINAGGLFVRGNTVANSLRNVTVKDSNIQGASVTQAGNVDGSAGIYLDRINSLEVNNSNFFENDVANAPAATAWAAALKFHNLTGDAQPAVNIGFNAANPVTPANYPLQNNAEKIPVLITGNVEIRDNTVAGGGAGTIGTISVPNFGANAPYYKIFGVNVFRTAGAATTDRVTGNAPAPANDPNPTNDEVVIDN